MIDRYVQKIENIGFILHERTGILEFRALYPGAGEDLAFASMPFLGSLTCIDTKYSGNPAIARRARHLAEENGIDLLLIGGDAATPEGLIGDRTYNLIIDKRGIRSLRSAAIPSMDRVSTIIETDYFGRLEQVRCSVDCSFGYPSIQVENPREGGWHILALRDFPEGTPGYDGLMDAVRQAEFGSASIIWESYLKHLEKGGAVLSTDPLSAYLADLGLQEIALSPHEIARMHFGKDEAAGLGLMLRGYNEGPDALLEPPRLYIK